MQQPLFQQIHFNFQLVALPMWILNLFNKLQTGGHNFFFFDITTPNYFNINTITHRIFILCIQQYARQICGRCWIQPMPLNKQNQKKIKKSKEVCILQESDKQYFCGNAVLVLTRTNPTPSHTDSSPGSEHSYPITNTQHQ